MGCDIHAYREKFVGGQWQSADKWTAYNYGDDDKGQRVEWKDCAYTGRNYDLFGLLSKGVRRNFEFGLPPRGLPFDASEQVAQEMASWSPDGHGHSYLYLHELKALRQWANSNEIPIQGMMDHEQLAKLRQEMASPEPTFENLYPYCGSTNNPRCVEFELNLPMDLMVGKCLDELIHSFDGIDGENHRLVFFFES